MWPRASVSTPWRRRGGGGGKHAVSLGWGAWRESGSSTGLADLIQRHGRRKDIGTITNEVGAAAVLDWAFATSPCAAVAVLPIERTRFLASFGTTRPPAAMRTWRQARRIAVADNRRGSSKRLSPNASSLIDLVTTEAASVLGYPPGQAISRSANLFELGLDSLMAVELRNRLQARLPGQALSATLLFGHFSVDRRWRAHLGGSVRLAAPPLAVANADAPIAIVGAGCRFPAEGGDPSRFWQALAGAQDGIIPRPDRPDASGGRGRRGPPAIYRKSPGSIRHSSGSHRGKPCSWTRSTGCCSKSSGRRWKTH